MFFNDALSWIMIEQKPNPQTAGDILSVTPSIWHNSELIIYHRQFLYNQYANKLGLMLYGSLLKTGFRPKFEL